MENLPSHTHALEVKRPITAEVTNTIPSESNEITLDPTFPRELETRMNDLTGAPVRASGIWNTSAIKRMNILSTNPRPGLKQI